MIMIVFNDSFQLLDDDNHESFQLFRICLLQKPNRQLCLSPPECFECNDVCKQCNDIFVAFRSFHNIDANLHDKDVSSPSDGV